MRPAIRQAAARAFLAAGLAVALLPAAAAAGVLVLKDGRALRHDGDVRREGALVVFRLEDGTLVSIRDQAVDWPATARAGEVLGMPVGAPRLAAPGRGRGPQELESLAESKLLEALVHTGRSGRGPREDEAARAEPPAPRFGPPRPRRPVDLLLLDVSPEVRSSEVAELPVPAPPVPAPPAPLEPPLARPWVSPYVGPPGEASDGRARERLAPLAPLPARPPAGTVKLGSLLERGTALEPEPPARHARFTSPRDGEAVFGATALRAEPGPGAPVIGVEYRVDGAPVGRAGGPPFEVTWRAPAAAGEHELEARIQRGDGSIERALARVRAIVPDAQVDVDLVPLAVAVTNHEYFFVRELEASDFLVFEDGVRQEVAHFSRDPVPLTILVLADVSWSMNGRKLEMAAEGLGRLSERLGPEDRLGAAVFNEQLRVLVPPTVEREQAAQALREAEADGGTAMFDAEIAAIRALAPEGGRRVLILLGDGEDYLSRARPREVIVEAQRANVTVYAIGLLTYRLSDGMPEHWAAKLLGSGRPAYWTDRLRVRGLRFLREQADATGGILYLPKFVNELPYVFEHLLAEMKSSYSLGYYPSNRSRDGRFRSIEVYVDGKGLAARTRRGYYAPGQPADALLRAARPE